MVSGQHNMTNLALLADMTNLVLLADMTSPAGLVDRLRCHDALESWTHSELQKATS